MTTEFDKVVEICKNVLPRIKVVCLESPRYSTAKMNSKFNSIVSFIYEELFEPLVHADCHANDESSLKNLISLDLFNGNGIGNQMEPIVTSPDDMWIFGYGSLMWKADFPFIERKRGFICGYQRLFYQNSVDHRGTVEKPGRVVTLLPTSRSDSRVYGVAYRIAADQKDEVLKHLDYREKNGYQRCTLKFYEYPKRVGGHWDIVMYLATAENESYAGKHRSRKKIAEQILTSSGSSGTNREYLFNLAHAMRLLFPGVDDKHLFTLEEKVRTLIANIEAVSLRHTLKRDIRDIVVKVVKGMDGSQVDEQATQMLKNLRSACKEIGWKERLLSRDLMSSRLQSKRSYWHQTF